MFTEGLFRSILGSIAPQNCLICDDIFLGFGSCEICFSLIKPRLPPLCEGCGRFLKQRNDTSKCIDCLLTEPPFDGLWAHFDYEPVAGHMIQYAKRWGLAPLIYQLMKRIDPVDMHSLGIPFDGIVPIPDRSARLVQRGFSTTKLMSVELGKKLNGIPVLSVLGWRKKTERQSVLNRVRRLENMKGAFKSRRVTGKRLLLLDDVYTTGSTLRAGARALKVAGAESVYAFAIAYRHASHSMPRGYRHL